MASVVSVRRASIRRRPRGRAVTSPSAENEGLIVRTEYQQIPPKVEYSLSEIGEEFKKVLAVMEVWGNEYIEYLNSPQEGMRSPCRKKN